MQDKWISVMQCSSLFPILYMMSRTSRDDDMFPSLNRMRISILNGKTISATNFFLAVFGFAGPFVWLSLVASCFMVSCFFFLRLLRDLGLGESFCSGVTSEFNFSVRAYVVN